MTTTPPAPRAERITDEQKPEPAAQLVDGTDRDDKRSSEQHLAAAGVLLARFPHGYRQQETKYLRGTLRRLSRALADGYGPAAVVLAAQRHDQPEHNPTRTLEHALRELAADVHAGACPECGHDPDGPRPICDACNPDRDTLTPAELEALAAAGWLTDEEQHA